MTTDAKPEVTIPDGQPPGDLLIEDVFEGDGATAAGGSNVTVHYVGVSWSSRAQFDSSWDRGDHFRFRLGAGQVIAGWDAGVSGMRVGGRRRLTIPPPWAMDFPVRGGSSNRTRPSSSSSIS